ncbi:MAG: response regulator transcription factor [Jiangellaceae bacterium]
MSIPRALPAVEIYASRESTLPWRPRHGADIRGATPCIGRPRGGWPIQAYRLGSYCTGRREREMLNHIMAGRTYGEIARELVVSEKTVSVHVSHLLHKTGTANRVELAQLARRVAKAADN